MLKTYQILPVLMLTTACNGAGDLTAASSTECLFEFPSETTCGYTSESYNITVEFIANAIDADEYNMQSLLVIRNSKKYILPITKDTSLFEGDRGYILFDDINFDSIPDLGVSTSFGRANLYLDYWVFSPGSDSYIKVGNFPRLVLNKHSMTISTSAKVNASDTSEATMKWDKGFLVPAK